MQNKKACTRQHPSAGALTESQMNDQSNFDANGNFTEKGWETMEGIDWNQEYSDRSWERNTNTNTQQSVPQNSTIQPSGEQN